MTILYIFAAFFIFFVFVGFLALPVAAFLSIKKSKSGHYNCPWCGRLNSCDSSRSESFTSECVYCGNLSKIKKKRGGRIAERLEPEDDVDDTSGLAAQANEPAPKPTPTPKKATSFVLSQCPACSSTIKAPLPLPSDRARCRACGEWLALTFVEGALEVLKADEAKGAPKPSVTKESKPVYTAADVSHKEPEKRSTKAPAKSSGPPRQTIYIGKENDASGSGAWSIAKKIVYWTVLALVAAFVFGVFSEIVVRTTT